MLGVWLQDEMMIISNSGLERKHHSASDGVHCVRPLYDFLFYSSLLSLLFLHLNLAFLGDNETCALQLEIFFKSQNLT